MIHGQSTSENAVVGRFDVFGEIQDMWGALGCADTPKAHMSNRPWGGNCLFRVARDRLIQVT